MAYSPGDYPLPAHACYVWLDEANNTIRIGLPPTHEHERGHSVAIPLDKCSIEASAWGTTLARQRGWEELLRLLKARARETRPDRDIGTAATITQDQLDNALLAIERRTNGGPVRNQGYDTRGVPKVVEPDALGDLFGGQNGK